MKKSLVSFFVVWPLYFLMITTRHFFLRFRLAQYAHNSLFYVAGKVFTTQPEHRRKFDALTKGIRGKNKLVEWQKLMYESNPNCWKHFFKNVFARRLVVGSVRRRYLARKKQVVPSTISVSLNMPGKGCNLSCKHCYAKGHTDTEIEPLLLERIIKEGEELGVYSIFMLGGEPFLYSRIWDFFHKFPQTTFWVATNGTLLGQEEINRISQLGNVVPIFSLEGFEHETDEMRGAGVFAKVISAMKICGDFKIYYLVSATVHRKNIQIVASKEFAEMLVTMRCIGVNYSCYVPVGVEAHQDWQITDEQSSQLDAWGKQLMAEYPIFSTIGRNGTGRVSDCYAARQYLHILPDGRVEPCPFAHYASNKFQEGGILGVTGSDFFKGIRYLHGLCKPGMTPCRSNALLDSYFQKLGAQKTTSL